jgi:hypothetical protein
MDGSKGVLMDWADAESHATVMRRRKKIVGNVIFAASMKKSKLSHFSKEK